jgi:hypothetical protein
MLKSEAAAIGTYKSRQGGPLFHHSIIPIRWICSAASIDPPQADLPHKEQK